MPTISFKAKIETVYNSDDTVAWQWLKVPAIARRHCDMNAFRTDAKYGSYANSDLFTSMLKRALKDAGVKDYIKLHEAPACVAIDASGFLARVTITI